MLSVNRDWIQFKLLMSWGKKKKKDHSKTREFPSTQAETEIKA